MFKSEVGEYKGSKTIALIKVEDGSEKRVLSFGIKKAKAILAQIEEIKKFVEENGNSKDDDSL